jgi:hypothetical protein
VDSEPHPSGLIISRARAEKVPVRQENFQVKTDSGFRGVTVEVIPVNGIPPNRGGFLIFLVNMLAL